MKYRHASFSAQVPKMNAEVAVSNSALYEKYGCDKGVFLSHIRPDSYLKFADPPVEAKSFITKVNDVPIDKCAARWSCVRIDGNRRLSLLNHKKIQTFPDCAAGIVYPLQRTIFTILFHAFQAASNRTHRFGF